MGYDLSPVGLKAVGGTVKEVSDREVLKRLNFLREEIQE